MTKKISLIILLICKVVLLYNCNESVKETAYFSPSKLEYSPDGIHLAALDETGSRLLVLNSGNMDLKKAFSLDGKPSDMEWISNEELILTDSENSMIQTISLTKGEVNNGINVCKLPGSLAVSNDTSFWVLSPGTSELYCYDQEGILVSRFETGRYPYDLELSPDGRTLALANLLPVNAKDHIDVASSIQFFSVDEKASQGLVYLPYGSSNLRKIEFSPDGNWLFAVHTRGRVNLPTSQLEKGWVITNMLTIIDTEKKEVYASLPLDKLSQGAANPWDIQVSNDGKTLYAVIAGTHELGIVDLEKLFIYLSGHQMPEGLKDNYAGAESSLDVWKAVFENPDSRMLLADKLAALHAAGIYRRVPLDLNNPRSVSLSPDGKYISISGYFTGNVLKISTSSLLTESTYVMSDQPQADEKRKGEMLFNDASRCFQTWLSCVSCHPDGRADGLNWDLLNDGIGNPKNTKSLLLTHETPPVMSRGVRPDYSYAVEKGFHFIQFYQSTDEENGYLMRFLESMKPIESPYLTEKNRESIERGKQIFFAEKTACAKCHPAPLYTNLQMYDVGTRGSADRHSDFDTPTLIELWKSGPYLHDGSATNIEEVLTLMNKEDLHGVTSHLNEEEIKDLTLFLKSL